MTIATILLWKFPEAFASNQVRIVEDASGTQRIDYWDATLGVLPTQAKIQAWGVSMLKEKAFACLKDKRLEEEYKGAFIEVEGAQVRFPSEVKDETRLNSLMNLFEKNPALVVENWKVAENVYVTMTAPLAVTVKNASFMHIANTFSIEKQKRAAIETLQTVADIDAWITTELNKDW